MSLYDRLGLTNFWERLRVPRRLTQELIWGVVLGVTFSLSSTSLALLVQGWRRRRAIVRVPPRPIELRSDEVVDGVIGLIGNTPLIRINSLSDALGVEILGKAEFLNPGGSVKDRVALQMIEDAESQGLLRPHTGCVLFEGTVGSTGISLATVGRAKGYDCCIIMPDDVSAEKAMALEKLGATVETVRPASIVDEKQFVNLARRRALEFGKTDYAEDDVLVTIHPNESAPTTRQPQRSYSSLVNAGDERGQRGFFADQFENESNFKAHYNGTGPEILRQTSGHIDAFVSGAGTGGTIAGTGQFLKKYKPDIKIVLSDPEGSGLYNKVRFNVMYDAKESEGTKRRHQVDTVVEGIGINRITKNFAMGLDVIDGAYRVTDAEAVAMSRYLVQHDGLFLGSSSGCNLVACVRLAKRLKQGARIVTILCDSGSRHQSKFWSDEYLAKAGVPIDTTIIDRLLDQ